MEKLFERAFLINLDFRSDRRKAFFERIPKCDWLPEIEVWPAIHGDTCHPPDNWAAGGGAWGCYRSHLSILEYCLSRGVSSYVVFEDDAQFKPEFATYIPKVISELDPEWQQLYLGGQLLHEKRHPPIRLTENTLRPFNVNRTHCFSVSQSGMLPIYKHLNNLPFHGGEHIDHQLGRLHETLSFQVVVPGKWTVGQGGDSSDITGRKTPINFWHDPESLAINHWLYSRPVCIVLRAAPWVKKELPELHSGYNKDSAGFDKGLTLAAKYAEPAAEINRWYSFVRTEVVHKKDRYKLPCLFHPRITDEMLRGVAFEPIVIEANCPDEAREKIQEVGFDVFQES